MQSVLLVDDDSAVLDTLSMMLRKIGYAVYQAAGPDEAERMFRLHKGEISIAIIDRVISGGDGFLMACEYLGESPNLAVVVISAFFDPSGTLFHSRFELLEKPVTVIALKTAIENALAKANVNRLRAP